MAYEMGMTEPYPLGEGDRFRVFRGGTFRREDLDLTPLSDLQNWKVAPGEPDIRGWDLVDSGGDQFGKVQDLIVSPVTRESYFIVAQVGGVWGMGGKRVLVPLDRVHINRQDHKVRVDATRDQFENAMEWKTGEEFDYPAAYRYWTEGMVTTPTETREMAGVRGGEAMGETTIPLREEELVSRREVHTGEVDVEKHVVTEHKTVDMPVTHTEVEVERRAVTGERRAEEGSIAEGEVRIPLRSEEVHVEKEPVVREEIVVRQHPVTETQHITEDVRREVAEVHKKGDVDVETKGDIEVK